MTFVSDPLTASAVLGAPDAASGLARNAREDAHKAWLRLPVSIVVSGFLFAFVGVGEGAAWLAAIVTLEGIGLWTRARVAAGDGRFRLAHLACMSAVSLMWVLHAVLLWRTESEIAHIAAIMDLFTAALYGAIGAHKDRQLLLVLMAPPLATLTVLLITFLWSEASPAFATFASVATLGAVATIALNAFALHRSDVQLVAANAALDFERRALDVRVKERTRALSLAMEEAQAANLAKSQFLATMSHELRTPLSAVIGYAEILEDELRANPAGARAEDAAQIARAARDQLAMINDVLDYARIDAGQSELSLADVDLRTLLEGVEANVAPLARANGNTLTVRVAGLADPVRTDAARLRQCVLSLAANACKFTRNGDIRIAARADGAWVEIAVADTGRGIAPEHHATIFQPFVQTDGSAARAHGGVGLGLALTRRQMTLLGGTVSVRSALDAGATFTLRLPLG